MTQTGLAQLEQSAREYLAAQLGPRAPTELRFVGAFDETPLDGEGPTVLFEFTLPTGSPECGTLAPRRHVVAVGETTPNYFPAYEFDAEDLYSFHVGTRFWLEMQVARLDAATHEPPGAREAVTAFVAGFTPGRSPSKPELVALFRCEDQCYAVYQFELDGEPYYVMGGDCPPGFYALTAHPPQVALRLHLGKLIREEARRPQKADET
jgi:hypothetical protein